MARKATIYRARVDLHDVDRGIDRELQLTLARHPSETAERLVVRLLAFALRYQDALEFGRGVSTRDEPDVWSREGDGRVREWIEVGQPKATRLVKAARRSARVSVFAFGGGLARWRESQLPELAGLGNVDVCRIDDDFVSALVTELDRSIHWTLTVSDKVLFLNSGEHSLDTVPERLLGDPLA